MELFWIFLIILPLLVNDRGLLNLMSCCICFLLAVSLIITILLLDTYSFGHDPHYLHGFDDDDDYRGGSLYK